MKFTRHGSVQLVAGVIAGASLIVVACGGDDSTGTTTPADAGATSSSGGSSGTASSSGSTTTDGGATDGGGEGGAKKANGEGPCTTGAECQSGECFAGKKESFCSIKCDNLNDTDPKCEALKGDFSGECNSQGYCKLK